MIKEALQYLSSLGGNSVQFRTREQLENGDGEQFLVRHNDLSTVDLEKFQQFKRRQSATVQTTRISSLAEHVRNELERNTHENLEIYVADSDCEAVVIYDLWGKDHEDISRAGHAAYRAELVLPKTGNYIALDRLCGIGRLSQRDAVEALEDVSHLFADGEQAVAALRSLDADRIGKSSSSVQPLSQERSVLEKVDVSSKGEFTVPDKLTATFEPYPELGEFSTDVRLKIHVEPSSATFEVSFGYCELHVLKDQIADKFGDEIKSEVPAEARVVFGTITTAGK